MSLAQLQPFQQLNCLRAAISKGELYSWMCYGLLLWNLEVAPNWVYVEKEHEDDALLAPKYYNKWTVLL